MPGMDGEARREQIVRILEKAAEPVSGSSLAANFQVSRQVIVQDIALLRVTDKNILSTNKGYLIYGRQGKSTCKRIVAVKHEDSQTREELYLIVDAGARIKDVVIEHEVYGQISVDLIITSRKDADEFLTKISADRAKPLKELSGGVHYHTIEADNEAVLDEVEKRLREKGYLLAFPD